MNWTSWESLSLYKVFLLCFNVSIAVGLSHWTWRGAEQLASIPVVAPKHRDILVRYRRYRWLALAITIGVTLLSFLALTESSTNQLSIISIVALCAHGTIGKSNFNVRYIFTWKKP